MTIREDLRTAARDWLIGLTDATDGKVIDAGADPKGPRPALPYVTVRVTSLGDSAEHGPAERIDGLTAGDAPQETMQERRTASVSFQGFGSGSAEWFDQAQIRMDSAASLTLQDTGDIVVMLQSAPTDISAQLDLREESRFSFEIFIVYQYQDDPVEQIEVTSTVVSIELERYEGDPDTLDASFALDADGNPTSLP